MSVEQIDAWECPGCRELYDSRYDAADCCSPPMLRGWRCGGCGELYEYESAARECHGSGPPLCVCGCPPRWHQEGLGFGTVEPGMLCLSPGCACRGFAWAMDVPAPPAPREQGVLL